MQFPLYSVDSLLDKHSSLPPIDSAPKINTRDLFYPFPSTPFPITLPWQRTHCTWKGVSIWSARGRLLVPFPVQCKIRPTDRVRAPEHALHSIRWGLPVRFVKNGITSCVCLDQMFFGDAVVKKKKKNAVTLIHVPLPTVLSL